MTASAEIKGFIEAGAFVGPFLFCRQQIISAAAPWRSKLYLCCSNEANGGSDIM